MNGKKNYTSVRKAIIEKINAAGYDFEVKKCKYLSKKGYYYHSYRVIFKVKDLTTRFFTAIYATNNKDNFEIPAPGATANDCNFDFKMPTISYGSLKGADLTEYIKNVTKAAELVNWLNENANVVNGALRAISKSEEGEGFKIFFEDKTNE